ncbi:MAG: prepilin-type N-terminal cleavage/methylation domain-containing protein [bacterium]|nr:prepilin-type N-terminal cleavage/methylation domain-containing protein [bacterium]
MVQQIIDNEDGYTVVEILVALTLLTIISTIVGSVFIFTARQMNNWRESVNTINESQITTERLYRDALLSNYISKADSNLVFKFSDGRTTQYSNLNHALTRNGIPISDHGDSLYIKRWRLEEKMSRFELKYIKGDKSNIQTILIADRQPKLWEAVQRR